jgi:dTDP-4-amino-4,6-dideoxygalactose transaminase
MQVPLLDLKVLYDRYRDEIDGAVRRCLDEQHFIMGPDVGAFEKEVVAYLGEPSLHAVGCANGSDAIILALLALGIGAGDEVICPVYTFLSTATSIALVNARPVFVDIDGATFNIDIERIAAAVTPNTRAIIPVHLFGRAADVVAIRALLDGMGRSDIAIIEDSAQSLGAKLDGKHVCTFGELATISFFPSKNLGGYGDGGMVVARDAGVTRRLKMLRAHGSEVKYTAELLGYNSRLDTIQAAILRTKLPHLDDWCAERRVNADRYRALLGGIDLPDSVALPIGDGADGRFYHIYNQFTLRTPNRDALQDFLKAAGVATAVYYPRPLSLQPCFASLGYKAGDFPVAEAAALDSVSLPIYPGLQADQQEYVVEKLAAFYR